MPMLKRSSCGTEAILSTNTCQWPPTDTVCLQKAHGWSDKALQAAAEQLQLSPAVTGMIERGPAELIEVLPKTQHAHLLPACALHACNLGSFLEQPSAGCWPDQAMLQRILPSAPGPPVHLAAIKTAGLLAAAHQCASPCKQCCYDQQEPREIS